MIVSWNWLNDYVDLSMSADELTERLTLSGLNLEGTKSIGEDLAIDLEVTSNRPDCLGHIGVAREISALWGSSLKKPSAVPNEGDVSAASLTSVTNQCPELCRRYTGRVIQGVRVGPSPEWLTARLATLGIAAINNVVDITNYVMMECGQPLHAFDFAALAENRIIVRNAIVEEEFIAIDHKAYRLDPSMCVIADAAGAVALGGVMGGAETEVSNTTTDLLIEAADFDPLTIRNTVRQLNLPSPSSYRFERGVDPAGTDWASRRCCELILKVAGGTLAAGLVDTGALPTTRDPIVLRLSQLPRILGIEIPADTVRNILSALGNQEVRADANEVEVVPPSWRADLTREVDLVEEVGRIHGYDKIPEDVGVVMASSRRGHDDEVLAKVREVLVAAGFDEAMTISAVEPKLIETFRPWTTAEPLRLSTPVLRGADRLRQSLIPSLLAARQTNETASNSRIELFEIARVYLPREADLPDERRMLAISSGGGFFDLKGVVEAIVQRVAPGTLLRTYPRTPMNVSHGRGIRAPGEVLESGLKVTPSDLPLFQGARSCQFRLGDSNLGVLGEVAGAGLEAFDLRSPTTIAELDLSILIAAAQLVPQAMPLSAFPPVDRDLNVVFDEAVAWADVERIVRTVGEDLLESLAFQEVYRDEERLGPDKKSLLLSVRLRSVTGTLTNEQADALRDRVVAQLEKELGGILRA